MENKNIIQVPVSSIFNRFSHYKLTKVGDTIDMKKSFKKYALSVLFLTIFSLVGLPLTILLPNNTFYFFYKKTNVDFLNPLAYDVDNIIIKRFVFIVMALITIILYPYIVYVTYNTDYEMINYNWGGLYNSLLTNGYKPNKFEVGYIKVYKYKKSYICNDGNHRHKILEKIYPKDKLIEVILMSKPYVKK